MAVEICWKASRGVMVVEADIGTIGLIPADGKVAKIVSDRVRGIAAGFPGVWTEPCKRTTWIGAG